MFKEEEGCVGDVCTVHDGGEADPGTEGCAACFGGDFAEEMVVGYRESGCGERAEAGEAVAVCGFEDEVVEILTAACDVSTRQEAWGGDYGLYIWV